MRKVDVKARVPRYYQVYSSLLDRIKNGEFSKDEPLPAERRLTEEYGVSRITIVKAMDLLQNEGLIDRQHGRGTFIRVGKLVNDPSAELSLSDHLERQGLKPEWRVIKKDWFTLSDDIAESLNLNGNKAYFQVTVQLLADSKPIGYHQMQIGVDLARSERLECLPDSELLRFFRDFPIKQNCSTVRGFESVPANVEGSKLLDLDLNSPVLLIDLFYFNENGEIVEFIRSFFRGDSFRYSL